MIYVLRRCYKNLYQYSSFMFTKPLMMLITFAE